MKTASANTIRPAAAGFTLTELLVAMAISAVVLSQMLVATYSLQRSFEAANYRMSAQEDQLRMLDYVTRDLQMATAVTVQSNGAQITVTLPPVDTSAVDLNLGPLLNPLLATLGASPSPSPSSSSSATTVTYFVEGGEFVRQVGAVQTDIADTVASVVFTRAGSFMTVDVTFTPEFSNSPTASTQPATRATSQVYLRNVALVP